MTGGLAPESYEVAYGVLPRPARRGMIDAGAARHPDDVGDGEGGWCGVGALIERSAAGVPPTQADAPPGRAGLLATAAAVTFTTDIHPTYQAGLTIDALLAGGVSALACKVSEGTGLYKAGYHDFSQAAAAAKLPFSAYHFLRSENSGAAQAAWCRQCMGPDWGRVPVMLDWETSVAGTRADANTAGQFITEVRRLGGLITLNYLPRWYWSAIGSPPLTAGPVSTLALVQSSYGTNPSGAPAAIYPGNDSPRWAGFGGLPVSLLQFGSNMRVPGYSGALDVNAYRGPSTDLARTGWFTSPATPETDMTPEELPGTVVPRPANLHYPNGDPQTWPVGGGTSQPTVGYLMHGTWAEVQKVLGFMANATAAEISRDAASAVQSALFGKTLEHLAAVIDKLSSGGGGTLDTAAVIARIDAAVEAVRTDVDHRADLQLSELADALREAADKAGQSLPPAQG